MNKTISQYSIIFTLSFVVLGHCYALGYTASGENQIRPSLPETAPLIKLAIVSKLRTFISCYSGYDGSPLDCTFSQKINGLSSTVPPPPLTDAENNGGHFHGYSTRSFTYNKGDIQYSADKNGDPLIVEGSALSTPPSTGAILTHEIPLVSGNIEVESLVTFPIGWVCGFPCYTENTFRNLWVYNVKINDLGYLPAENPSDSYIRYRNPDAFHPFEEAYYGAPETIQFLPLIAENYFLLRGRKLSVNDMSLRKGGLFDVFGDWRNEHNSHREGKDVDLNRDYVDCLVDTNLFLAVDMILPPLIKSDGTLRILNGKPTAVYCESRGRKHIDFEFSL